MVARGYTNIEQGELVDTFSHSHDSETRRKAAKFGAMGSIIGARKRDRAV